MGYVRLPQLQDRMITPSKHLWLLAALALVSACTTDRTFGAAADIEITSLEELPAPRGELAHRISAQEKLEITVAGVENLSGTFLTDEFGRITYPLLGELDLNDITPGAASRLIEGGLRGRYLLDPQVRVIPEDFPLPSISVGGQVKKPGSYPAAANQTLLRVVNLAEGLQEYAQLDDVLIMRTVDGQKYIGAYNLEAIQRGNYPDPVLYPNDVVMVGDSPARRRLDNILQFVPLITASAIVIDRIGR